VAAQGYTQTEADWMMSLNKLAEFETELYAIADSHRPGFIELGFNAVADPQENPSVRFKILTAANFSIGAYSIEVLGEIGNRGIEGLCRYEIHDSLHSNNHHCCASPPEIDSGQFHSHRFNECAMNAAPSWR
jgi:hypothetical protein